MTAETDNRQQHGQRGLVRPLPRSAGVLLHPTSLPGAGDLGDEARHFVDWLAACKVSIWQILPLVPAGPGESPYSSWSAFCGNPWLIDLHGLAEQGLLDRTAVGPLDALADAEEHRSNMLVEAATRFLAEPKHPWHGDLERFRDNNPWLAEAALFRAVCEAENGAPWWEWDEPLRARKPGALRRAARDLYESIERISIEQFFFERQWQDLRQYCRERGVSILGDLPIYVAANSADTWAHQEQFCLGSNGAQTVEAGAPPDAFSELGQLWGNPLYRWNVMAEDGFQWWIERMRRATHLADWIRLDHFRAFAAYWEVPTGAADAREGHWVQGPGDSLFQALHDALGPLPLIAEDLGIITEDVDHLRTSLGIPGMRVLQFAFGGDDANPHMPHNHGADSVIYTGTHDHPPLLAWWNSVQEWERQRVRDYLGVSGHEIVWDLIDCALASKGPLAVLPMQDLLCLGPEARMNTPATVTGNWAWRLEQGQLSTEVAARLTERVVKHGRVGSVI